MHSKNARRLDSLEAMQRQREAEIDAEWDRIVWKQLSDRELELVIAACEKAGDNGHLLYHKPWADANLTDEEVRAAWRLPDLAAQGGLQFWAA
jgi:hypothetical protein